VKFRGFRAFESIHIIHASYEVTSLRPWEKLETTFLEARLEPRLAVNSRAGSCPGLLEAGRGGGVARGIEAGGL